MSYADCAGTNATDGVGEADALGTLAGLEGVGLAAFTTCQTNFFPLFTHLRETEPDLAVVPTFGQALPGDFAVAFEAEKARGVDRIAKANTAQEKTRADFLREAFM